MQASLRNWAKRDCPFSPTYGHAAVSLQNWTPKSSTLSMAVFYGGAPVALLQ